MDTGGVENPGAVNSRDDNARVDSEQELKDALIEDNGINFDVVADSNTATNEEKEYSFSSKDISKHKKTEFFTKVEGAEKRAKKAEKEKLKQERRSRKAILKEASKTKKNELKERNQKEAAKNREAKHIRSKYRMEKLRGFIWRYKALIILIVSVVTVATLAIIFVPKIIDSIDKAHKEQLVAENKTDMMKVFIEIAGKEYEKTEFENTIKGISDKLTIEYYDVAGTISAEDTGDTIDFDMNDYDGDGAVTISLFRFSGVIDGVNVEILPNGDNYDYYENFEVIESGSVDDMINKIIFRRSGMDD